MIGVTSVISQQKKFALQEIRDRNMCDSCNLCDFIKSDWCNLCDFSKNKTSLKIKGRNMCDLRNLCDFLIRESEWSHINILRNKCDLSNICDLSKTSSRTF